MHRQFMVCIYMVYQSRSIMNVTTFFLVYITQQSYFLLFAPPEFSCIFSEI